MTCIAWDGKWLAGDSLLTDNGARDSEGQKVFKLRDGTLIGFSGAYEDGLVLVNWMKQGEPEEGRPKRLSINAIKVTPNGEAFTCEGKLKWWPMKDRFYAIGSGAPYAKTAMRLGLSAREAVRIAEEFDRTTGGKINMVTNRKRDK